jgi:hypothetical protein
MIKRWTWYFTLLLLLSGSLDALSTTMVSPDLSGEHNPLIVALGRSWSALFFVKGLTLLTAPLVFAISLRILARRSARLCGKTGFAEIMSHLFFKQSIPFAHIATAYPKDPAAVAAFLGLCIALAPPVAATLATFSNTFRLVNTLSHVVLFYTLTILLVLLLAHYLTYRLLSRGIEAERRTSRGTQ